MESAFEGVITFLFSVITWPGIVASLLLATIGLLKQNVKLLKISLALCLPFTFVCALHTMTAVMVPVSLLCATYLASLKCYKLAAAAVIPAYFFVTYVAYLVIQQPMAS